MSVARAASSSLVRGPKVMRRLPAASASPNPMAASTGEGRILLAAHAAPVPTSTPRRSSKTTSREPDSPGNATCRRFGRRRAFFAGPEKTASGKAARSFSCIASRMAAKRRPSSTRRAAQASNAAAKPITPATFSVPERTPPSCPPPKTRGRKATPSAAHSRPTCLGPPSFAAETVSKSA